MQPSRIQSILRSLQDLSDPIRVHGATAASRSLILSKWATETHRVVVVICPSDEVAEEIASDLETLSQTIEGNRIAVEVFPGWEPSLYSPIAPSLRTRLARIGTLARISSGGLRVICTTLMAASQHTLPPETLQQFSIRIKTGESISSREALITQLLEAGYLRVDPVEDIGTFAVRGEIIDIYPVGQRRPFRVELFGEEVERIRTFDPTSQRTDNDSNQDAVQIGPAREVLINPRTAPRIRERLKTRADDLGISRAFRDPILAGIQDGVFPDHNEAWASFAYLEPGTLWSYVPASSCSIAWVDELSCRQNWDSFLEEQKRLAKESEGTLIAPPVEQMFLNPTEAEVLVRAGTRLYLDQVELADLQVVEKDQSDSGLEGAPAGQAPRADDEVTVAPRHRVDVLPNSKLGQGSRQSLGDLEPKFTLWRKQGYRTVVLASTQSQIERIRLLLEQRDLICKTEGPPEPGQILLAVGQLSEGFRWPAEGLSVLTESEILGQRGAKRQRRTSRGDASASKEWSGLQALSDLSLGDVVVHVDHGLGRYQGLVRLDLSGAPSDFLLLEYSNKDKLYLPVYRLNVIQKYVGSSEQVTLDRLGSQTFTKTKEKVRDAVKNLAIDLVQLYAEREIRPGVPFSPRDSDFREFEARFPFDETPDQLKAIDSVLSDLESGKSMDRLVCGDVGYGKTEVAIRAAFRAVSDGKQVAVLVPTTVLAHQHEQSFRARLKEYPVTIESLSRFKSAKEQKTILEGLAAGKVDIVIGTHRLLSKDMKFQDLGLLIIDEEHRFGVEHKEKLKALKINTHVLTLTATPIPRTLHMALSGLRDISLINTPPVDRLPIRTFVSKSDDSLIKRAIEFELNRGGQVFFVHNRVQTIHDTARRLRDLVPTAQVIVGHGQMSERELEETMEAFYQKRANVLVSTTIIESGLDIPTANTVIINRADTFGLAQLYQIRGRVGRSQQRAYAYLLIPQEGAVTDDAKRRLEVIQRFVELGSGFSIASHDLEIRGGGDLLGPQQSGHIAAVGFDLYTELLEEAIREIQGRPLSAEESRREPEIKTPYSAYLSEEYVPDVHQRLSLYRRLSASVREEDLIRIEEELQDRFGPLPTEAQNLLWLIRIKQLLKAIGIDSLTVGPEKVSLVPSKDSGLDPIRAIALVSRDPKKFQLMPDSKFVVRLTSASLKGLLFELEKLFRDMTQ